MGLFTNKQIKFVLVGYHVYVRTVAAIIQTAVNQYRRQSQIKSFCVFDCMYTDSHLDAALIDPSTGAAFLM